MSAALLESRLVGQTDQQQEVDWSEYAAEAAATTPRRPAVLLVDDNPLVRSMLGRALREQGITVWTAVDGQHALELCRHHDHEIDVTLLDMRMPGQSGPQTLAAFHEIAPAMSVCFLSGRIDICAKEELLQAGAARVFDKPFRPVELARVVQGLLAKRQRMSRRAQTDYAGAAANSETNHANGPCRHDGRGRSQVPGEGAIHLRGRWVASRHG
jgi:CheY-like chemotaxis protein